ncbi:MAG: hypothetical protein GPI99_08570 [Microcystis aeruginosa W13-15]|nr:hypothetical protein [Microcystis aeruginosa W13-15]
MVNALVFNGKAVVLRRGFRPKIFDDQIRLLADLVSTIDLIGAIDLLDF